MARYRVGQLGWGLAVAMALVAPAVVWARGAADEPGGSGNAKDGQEPNRKTRKVSREVGSPALAPLPSGPSKPKRERGAGPGNQPAPPAKLPDRPARVVVAPTLNAAGVDALVEKHLLELKVTPAPLSGDEEFVRRIYLDVAGVLPTPAQVLAFRRDRSPEKRTRLIDELLSTPDHARNWARYWRDVIKFRATNENGNQTRFQVLEDWLAEQIGKNTPWDEVATTLITATGRVDQNGATGLIAAHQGQAVELAGEVSRIFLGVQIQCAQCHDHPNDPWKREQFHEFAAFFAGTRIQPIKMPAEQKPPAEKEKTDAKSKELKDKDKNKDKARAEKPKPKAPPIFEVVMKGVPRYTMPDRMDPQKQIPIEPKFFLAVSSEPVPPRLTAEQRHALIASYITGQDDPWFAKAYVNRVWGALMGEGFFNPIDDLGPTRTPAAPAVLDALASEWQRGGYDVRWLFRTILNTKAYQREFRPSTTSAGKTPFAANVPGRLRADQILDSLAEVLEVSMDAPRGPRSPGQIEKPKGKGGPFRNNPRNQFLTLFGVDPSTPVDDVLGTIPQALFLMNGGAVNQAIEARPNTMLGQILLSHPDNKSALEALYLRVLARRPTPAELRVCDHHLIALRGDRKTCFEDILWCLVNSTEFLSRR